MLGSYVVAILFETHGPLYLKRFLMINSILAVAFSALRIFLDEKFSMGFMVFIIYCLLNIIFVSAQLYRSRKENPHFIWLAAGIVFLVTGSVLQTIKSIHFTIIWEFNYNCVYHIFTLIFVILRNFFWSYFKRYFGWSYPDLRKRDRTVHKSKRQEASRKCST